MRVRSCAESVAFVYGGAAEYAQLARHLRRTVGAQLVLNAWQTALQFAVSLGDYAGSILSYVVIAVPIFLGRYDALEPTALAVFISRVRSRSRSLTRLSLPLNLRIEIEIRIGDMLIRLRLLCAAQASFQMMYLVNAFTKLLAQSLQFGDVVGCVHRISRLLEALERLDEEPPCAPPDPLLLASATRSARSTQLEPPPPPAALRHQTLNALSDAGPPLTAPASREESGGNREEAPCLLAPTASTDENRNASSPPLQAPTCATSSVSPAAHCEQRAALESSSDGSAAEDSSGSREPAVLSEASTERSRSEQSDSGTGKGGSQEARGCEQVLCRLEALSVAAPAPCASPRPALPEQRTGTGTGTGTDWSLSAHTNPALREHPSTTCDAQSALVVRLSLTLEARRSVLVTGASGVGKSSLLRVMRGLWRPLAGRVCWAIPRRAGDGDGERQARPLFMFCPQVPFLTAGTLLDQVLDLARFTLTVQYRILIYSPCWMILVDNKYNEYKYNLFTALNAFAVWNASRYEYLSQTRLNS